MSPKRQPQEPSARIEGYDSIVSGLVDLLETARRVSARSVNAIMTATYWEIGRRIVKSEQRGEKRAEYGEALLRKLASDLTARFGRGFGVANLAHMRKFFLTWPEEKILRTASVEFASNPGTGSNVLTIHERHFGGVVTRRSASSLVADIAFAQLPDHAPDAIALSSFDYLKRC